MPEENAGIQDARAVPTGVEQNTGIQPMGGVTPSGPDESMFEQDTASEGMNDGPAGQMLEGDPESFSLSADGDANMPGGPEGDLLEKDEVDKQVEEFNQAADSKAQQEEGKPEAEEASTKETPPADNADQSFKIGDQNWSRAELDTYLEKSVPLMAEVDKLASEGHDIGQLMNEGIKHQALMGQLIDNPESAINVINGLIHGAIMEHGSDLNPEKLNIQSLDVENMTQNEKILYDQNIKLQKDMRRMAANMGTFVSEANSAVTAQGEVARVKQETGLDITAEQLSTMKKTTGMSDPVNAVKISTYGQTGQSPAGAQKQPGQATAEVPSVTNQATGFFDEDGDYSADQINRMMSAGMRPATGKQLEAIRAKRKQKA